jgi:hypothetical protein
VHAKTDETGGSCLPTRDTTANVDEQHEGIISNSSRFTNSSLSARNIIILPFFMTLMHLLIYTHCFPILFLHMEPPIPEALRGSEHNVESICNLLQTSTIIDELPGQVPCYVFLHFLFSVGLAAFCFNFLYIL